MNVDRYLEMLTLEEKAALLQGWSTWTTREVKRLGIPAIFLSDGPTGLRKQAGAGDHLGLNASVPATCFPTSATMANSWDPELGEKLGEALGEEAAANDVHVVLGPGLNMKRSPLCGRNFEYFSEDPYLAGKMAAAYIKGIQSKGPSACPKHFAVNSQELRRMAMDSVVDERTLREIYLTGFEIAVQEGHAQSIMSSYNMVNGEYANENYHLLTEILRNEWGFDGFVVTDWGGDNEHTEGVRAGSNLVMPAPGPGCAIGLVEDVKADKISEKELDLRVKEFLKVAFERTEAVAKAPKTFDVDAHNEIARKCAEGSIVLLDNDGILPLAPNASVAVIGDFAQTPRYQGAGSSQVNPTKLDNLLDCAKAAGLNITGFAKGFSRTDPHPQNDLITEAVKLAESNETILLCVGLDEIAESEGMDRLSTELSKGQQALVEAVSKVNKNIILVLYGGSPFVMPERSTYRAAIHGYLGGQAGAGAMVDAIIGKVNPSGKLNETWPIALADNPSYPYYPSKERTSEHREGPYIGYRYYDTVGKEVRYPFGYGLSYTTVVYSDIKATKDEVIFTIKNTGKVDGAEVAQVYVSCVDGKIFRPKKELKGFTKVFLKAGESKTVTVKLDDKAFRYFNVKTDRWEIETADYEIMVAASVSDVKLSQTIRVLGTEAPMPYGELPAYESGGIENVSDAEFESLLGRSIPDGKWSGLLGKNDAICQLYYAKNPVARLVYKILTSLKSKAEDKGKPDLNILFIYNMPFRAIGKMAGGMVSDQMVDDILFIVNGHFFRGLGRLIVDFFKNLNANSKFVKKLEG
ncbi:MAG: glycoside hydrolase family 3 C-terminal domain-containing protein [Oscillospiraceae bacterium]|nr:glycoside hydrolase family 3 C-terminal domain-containing protein [Oscillospiraceae bacterium]